MTELRQQVISATKWSTLTEVIAKLVTPITSIVLARLLTPDDFGIMVTAIMVISFAEIFTDAGFQKYIIQQPFENELDLYRATNVAFLSNLILSITIWVIIIIFCQPIAELVGNKGHGDVIAISCVCIPLSSFSSIQMSLFKRALNFKLLFWAKSIGILVPIVATIPIAFVTRSYWALIIGMIAQQLSNAIILTAKSPWKPYLWYSWFNFKQMFSFSAWSMLEALSIWLTGYCDVFIISTVLNDYYLGIYRTSITTVGQILGIITTATTSVLFSSLSKAQNDENQFAKILFKFQKTVGLVLLPLSIGIFVFRSLITDILLGSQWQEATWFIGIWGLSSGITILLSHYCSEVLRAKGKPKLSTLSQVINIFILIPLILYAVHQPFNVLCDIKAASRVFLIIPTLIITYLYVKISPWKMISNIKLPLLSAIIMGVIGYFLTISYTGVIAYILEIALCSLTYILLIILFPSTRGELKNLRKFIFK